MKLWRFSMCATARSTYCWNMNAPLSASVWLNEYPCSLIAARKRLFLTACHTGASCDTKTPSRLCRQREWSHARRPVALLRHLICYGSTQPQCRFAMQGSSNNSSSGRILLHQQSDLCGALLALFARLRLQTDLSWVLSKNISSRAAVLWQSKGKRGKHVEGISCLASSPYGTTFLLVYPC